MLDHDIGDYCIEAPTVDAWASFQFTCSRYKSAKARPEAALEF